MRVTDRTRRLVPRMRIRLVHAVVLLLAIGIASGTSLSAQPGERAATSDSDRARELQQAIDQTLESPEYTWRTEADAAPWIVRVLESIEAMSDAIARWIRAIGEWLKERFGDRSSDVSLTEPRGYSIPMIAIAIAILSALLSLLYWRQTRRADPIDIESDRVSPLDAISVEESEAASVDSDRWIALSRELEREGRYRDAIRALYLAALSHLSEHGRIRLARHKSNRDYRRELARRDGSDAPVLASFTGCLSIFERTWYGRHSADSPLLGRMRGATEKILRFTPEHLAAGMPPPVLRPPDPPRLAKGSAE